ncbi:MAG TPA: chemotaxis protein CheW [Polyangiaceae bacterium]|jgi:purine-binding chemotaxis protein CheW|nr:chemotaxis protein CheW [Polyangiaceae bacterium]
MVMERQRRKDPSKNLVECVLGEVRYAVGIGAVREIVNPLPTVELPSAPTWVLGVADYRDEVVPVIDLRVRFGLAKTVATPRTKWIVVRRGEVSFALVVDAVTEVFRSGEVKPAPLLQEGADIRAIDGVTSHDGDLVFILDVARLGELVDPKLAEQVEKEVASRTSPPRRLA